MSKFPQAIIRHYRADHPVPALDFNPYQYLPFLKIFKNTEGKWTWNGSDLFIKDEVGVGKTIEAGIILYELWKQNNNLSALIVSPVKLRSNWNNEIRRFFGLEIETDGRYHQIMHLSYSDFIIRNDSAKTVKSNTSILELSLEEEKAAKTTGNLFIPKCIKDKEFDVIIADEAHWLRNEGSSFHKGIRALLGKHTKRGPVIFLTGTPVVNGSKDYKTIKALITSDDLPLAETASTQAEAYAMTFTPEITMKSVVLDNDDEKKIFKTADAIGGCAPRLAASSPSALLNMLERKKAANTLPTEEVYEYEDGEFEQLFIEQLDGVIKTITDILRKNDFIPAKQTALREFIQKDQKYIIFSCYIKTCEEIKRFLEEGGHSVECLTGSSNKSEIENAIRSFKYDKLQVLVCSDALSEGHNLQFCSNIIHYDLPFTPARVSQRNGRIYRHGQMNTPRITFWSVKGTYDEHLYSNIFLYKMWQADVLANTGDIVPMIGLPNIDELMSNMYQTHDQKEQHDTLINLMTDIVKDEDGTKADKYARIIEKSRLWEELSKKICENKDEQDEQKKLKVKQDVQEKLRICADILDKQQSDAQKNYTKENCGRYNTTAINVCEKMEIPLKSNESGEVILPVNIDHDKLSKLLK